jgi:GNAT superfamily N-acetyltransferase
MKEECLNDSEIHVFRAGKSHGEVLLSLIDALADYERLPKPDSAGRERLLQDAFGEHRRIEVFLAGLGEKTVGYAIVFETYSSFLALPTLYLEDLFVLPECRGREVGYHLFTHCVKEALARGCGRMDWAVLDWNQLAINFYERLGARQLKEWLPYRLSRIEMEKIVREESN